MSGDALADALLAAARLLWYAGMLGVIGASAFRLFVLPRAGRPMPDAARAAATAGAISALVLLAGTLARLYAQTYAYFGLEEPITPALLLEVARDLPPWSTGWMQQFAPAAVSLGALGLARTGSRPGWMVAHLAAVAVAASAPLTGHAVSQERWYGLPITLQAAHVLGAGVWLGGLFVLLTVGVRRASGRPDPGRASAAALVDAFSPLALCGAGLLAATGGVTALLYIESLQDLWTIPYGQVLLLKVALFAAVAAAGFVNWQRVRPRMASSGGVETLRRTAGVELALAAFVLAVTAILVGLPQGGH